MTNKVFEANDSFTATAPCIGHADTARRRTKQDRRRANGESAARSACPVDQAAARQGDAHIPAARQHARQTARSARARPIAAMSPECAAKNRGRPLHPVVPA